MCIPLRYWSSSIMVWIVSLELGALEFQRLLYFKLFTLYLHFFNSPHNIYGITFIMSFRWSHRIGEYNSWLIWCQITSLCLKFKCMCWYLLTKRFPKFIYIINWTQTVRVYSIALEWNYDQFLFYYSLFFN